MNLANVNRRNRITITNRVVREVPFGHFRGICVVLSEFIGDIESFAAPYESIQNTFPNRCVRRHGVTIG